jgi:DNA (cytosine-5)-methyltransferase 1
VVRVALQPLRLLDTFAGIGGFSLGLEATGGFETVAFCEREPYCRRLLAKRWPGVPCFPDVRKLTAEVLTIEGRTPVDIISGGFPCQDISYAGHGQGLAGKRSGLFFELHRLIREIRPRYAILENVAALRSRGLDTVLGELAAIGYDAEWHCIPAAALGAPHKRDRVWIVAYPAMDGFEHGAEQGAGGPHPCGYPVAPKQDGRPEQALRDEPLGGLRGSLPDANELRRRSWWAREPLPWAGLVGAACVADGHRARRRHGQPERSLQGLSLDGPAHARLPGCAAWDAEPDVGRVVDGLSFGLDGRRRLKQRIAALGNAIVPQIAHRIGLVILDHERRLRAAEAEQEPAE